MISIDNESCTACGICGTVCPRHIIETFEEKDEKHTRVSQVRKDLCMVCGHCTAVCPSDAIRVLGLDFDAFKPVSVFWDRISRPDQLMTACLQAIRFLTDPADTGAVTLCLPQDVQAEAFDYPNTFFTERTWTIRRTPPVRDMVDDIANAVAMAEKPLLICGGGVRYSEAGQALEEFCECTGIPFGETQAGRGVLPWDYPLNLSGIGVTGGAPANHAAAGADLVLAVGTRLGDFTTASKTAFSNPDVEFGSINVNPFDAHKMAAAPLVCDAREGLKALTAALTGKTLRCSWGSFIEDEVSVWKKEVGRLYGNRQQDGMLTQTGVLGMLNEELLPALADMVGIMDAAIAIFGAIFFLAAGLGIMNTMLMATFDRIKEFGVLKAIGTSPLRIVGGMAAEAFILTLVASVLGLIIGLAGTTYFQEVGIDTSIFAGGFSFSGIAWDPVWRAVINVKIVAVPIVVMCVICTLASLYPAIIAARLDPVRAIHHV